MRYDVWRARSVQHAEIRISDIRRLSELIGIRITESVAVSVISP